MNTATASGWATVALGGLQALAPQTAANVFGLDGQDEEAVWLTRLLGVAHLTVGSMLLSPEVRAAARPQRLGILAGEAAVTLVAATSGSIPRRTALTVLGAIAALVPGALAD